MTSTLRIEGDRWICIPDSFTAICADHDSWESGWSWRDREKINRSANPTAASILELFRYWTQCRIATLGEGDHWLHESINTLARNLRGIATSPKTIRAALRLLEARGYISVRRSEDSANDYRLNWAKVRKDAMFFLSKEEKPRKQADKSGHPTSPDAGESFLESEESEGDFFSGSGATIADGGNADGEGAGKNSGGVGNSAYKYKESLVNIHSGEENLSFSPRKQASKPKPVQAEQAPSTSIPTSPSGTASRMEASQPQHPGLSSNAPVGQKSSAATPERPFIDSYAAAGFKSPVARFEERFKGETKREYYSLDAAGAVQFDPDLLSTWVSEDPGNWVGEDGVVALGRLLNRLRYLVGTQDFGRLDTTWEAVQLRRQMGIAFPSVRALWVTEKATKSFPGKASEKSKPPSFFPKAPSPQRSQGLSNEEIRAIFERTSARMAAESKSDHPVAI